MRNVDNNVKKKKKTKQNKIRKRKKRNKKEKGKRKTSFVVLKRAISKIDSSSLPKALFC